jgi:invasion protein IalB
MAMRKFFPMAIVALLAAPGAGEAAAAAQAGPVLVGTYRDWFVYTNGAGANKVCYALSQPKQSTPRNANRDPIFFLISTFPAQKKNAQPSIVPGYPYKEDAKAEVQIGSDKFAFFTDGSTGWAEKEEDEPRMLNAMKRGSTMIVIGTSTRGTLTRDNYSLAGITAALDSVAAACK